MFILFLFNNLNQVMHIYNFVFIVSYVFVLFLPMRFVTVEHLTKDNCHQKQVKTYCHENPSRLTKYAHSTRLPLSPYVLAVS